MLAMAAGVKDERPLADPRHAEGSPDTFLRIETIDTPNLAHVGTVASSVDFEEDDLDRGEVAFAATISGGELYVFVRVRLSVWVLGVRVWSANETRCFIAHRRTIDA